MHKTHQWPLEYHLWVWEGVLWEPEAILWRLSRVYLDFLGFEQIAARCLCQKLNVDMFTCYVDFAWYAFWIWFHACPEWGSLVHWFNLDVHQLSYMIKFDLRLLQKGEHGNWSGCLWQFGVWQGRLGFMSAECLQLEGSIVDSNAPGQFLGCIPLVH